MSLDNLHAKAIEFSLVTRHYNKLFPKQQILSRPAMMMMSRLLVVSGCGPTRWGMRQGRPGMYLSGYLVDRNNC
jgi:hypothetical protein